MYGELIISTTATKPSKFQLKLRDSTSHPGTDIMSFRFTRSDDQQRNQYLNYKAGQYAVVDLGTKEDPEGPMRSFTVASSPTEEESILISTRIRDTPFKKKLANLDHRLIDPDLDPKFITVMSRRSVIGTIIYLIAATLSFFSTTVSLVLYIVIPIYYLIPARTNRPWLWFTKNK